MRQTIHRLAELLPSQGPVTAFAFVNTLQAMEGVPFEEGLLRGSRLYHAHPFYSEDKYLELMAQGRIQRADVESVLIETGGPDLWQHLEPGVTVYDLKLAMLLYPPRQANDEELRWLISETEALRRCRGDLPMTIRRQLIEETRSSVTRDMGGRAHAKQCTSHDHTGDRSILHGIFEKYNGGTAEALSERQWEAITLEYLWRTCSQGIHGVKAAAVQERLPSRFRDELLQATGEDTDQMVHDVLIRFCAPFVDQGQADWPMPHKHEGFLSAFVNLHAAENTFTWEWTSRLAQTVREIQDQRLSPLRIIVESLDALGVAPEEREQYLLATLLALKGWGGMLWQLESRPDRVPFPVQPGTFEEFAAVRLLLDRAATEFVLREKLKLHEPVAALRARFRKSQARQFAPSSMQRTFTIFQTAQACGWAPHQLNQMSKDAWRRLIEAVEAFHSVERRRIYHAAFERRYRIMALDAISARLNDPPITTVPPRFQALFCIDAREESFRRHLEEVLPDVETFGTAGFFGVPMYFKGVTEAHYNALCPIVIKPRHWVAEEVVETFAESHARRVRARKALGTASHRFLVGTRGLAGGAILTAGVGLLATAPLVARVLFPRLTARLFRDATRFVEPPHATRLRLERTADPPGPSGEHVGFSLEEMSAMAERALRDVGLVTNFARLVLFLGHGSSCINNPHASAYDCGACSGNAGAPNARAIALMLNDPRVRERLRGNGLAIPHETRFIGGLHNTGTDAITFQDLDLLPESHYSDLEQAIESLEAACQRNAHERCRRFDLAPLGMTLKQAHVHVEERCEDLAQTRPEYGNSTNAMCYVGRRSRIRGLYMDRRSFLMSYDPAIDDADATILGRILGAVVPVCEGINMQYSLSALDNSRWGCGSKLPHNITSLLGVMEGAASDLRPGLPWQGVDIHEPMRLLFVIETTRDQIRRILARDATVNRILLNGWAQLAIVDPLGSGLQTFSGGEFRDYAPQATALPVVGSSMDWYRGQRGHLGFALIDSRADSSGQGN